MPAYTVDAFPRRNFSGSITQIRKAAQVIQNVMTLRRHHLGGQPDLALVPGMTANTRITVDRRDNVPQDCQRGSCVSGRRTRAEVLARAGNWRSRQCRRG